MIRVNIFDYPVSAEDLEQDVLEAFSHMESGATPYYMACANPHSLVVASRDPVFKDALQHADLLLPDGTGVVLAARALQTPVAGKVAGYDFFIRMTEMAARKGGMRCFFIGSSPAVLNLIRQRLASEFPSVEVCGTYSPPFKEEFSAEENARMVEAINGARPDLLWVGMTAPKQEKWIHENRRRLQVRFIGAIGAAFDFYAGTKARPSRLWQALGLEWLPRFLKEPARLWERNLKSTPIFLCWLLKERVARLLKPGPRRKR